MASRMLICREHFERILLGLRLLFMGDFNIVSGSDEFGDGGDVAHYQCSRFND